MVFVRDVTRMPRAATTQNFAPKCAFTFKVATRLLFTDYTIHGTEMDLGLQVSSQSVK